MIELDERLRMLQSEARGWADEMRVHALALDRTPDRLRELTDLAPMAFLATAMIPPRYHPRPLTLSGHRYYGTDPLERAVVIEEAASADCAMVLAAPGPSLAGVAVDLLGDDEQKAWFYDRVLQRPTWTFFALTEPDHGSDAAAMETALLPASDAMARTGADAAPAGLLRGRKRYIGNADRAALGVVMARIRPGPLGIGSVLVETSAAGFSARSLPMIGLRAAKFCDVVFDDVAVEQKRVLGAGLPRTRQGMWAAVQLLNRIRPGVAAMALGIARGAYDYVRTNRRTLKATEQERLDWLGRRVHAVRQLVRTAAVAVARDPSDGTTASAAKARACRLAEEATLAALGFFGAGARLEHPMLDKYARDARGVEFMEGTENIQRLTVFQGVLAGRSKRRPHLAR